MILQSTVCDTREEEPTYNYPNPIKDDQLYRLSIERKKLIHAQGKRILTREEKITVEIKEGQGKAQDHCWSSHCEGFN
jgi:hypothetical protein